MRTWAQGDGRCPSSLLASLWHSAAARLAPVLSPPTATLRGSTLNSASATDRKWHVAVSQSSSWAGYLCSGANRYLREVRGTTEDNMLDSGSLLDWISFGMLTCFVEKVTLPNRNHNGARLFGDVPTDFINRICSGLAEHHRKRDKLWSFKRSIKALRRKHDISLVLSLPRSSSFIYPGHIYIFNRN